MLGENAYYFISKNKFHHFNIFWIGFTMNCTQAYSIVIIKLFKISTITYCIYIICGIYEAPLTFFFIFVQFMHYLLSLLTSSFKLYSKWFSSQIQYQLKFNTNWNLLLITQVLGTKNAIHIILRIVYNFYMSNIHVNQEECYIELHVCMNFTFFKNKLCTWYESPCDIIWIKTNCCFRYVRDVHYRLVKFKANNFYDLTPYLLKTK